MFQITCILEGYLGVTEIVEKETESFFEIGMEGEYLKMFPKDRWVRVMKNKPEIDNHEMP